LAGQATPPSASADGFAHVAKSLAVATDALGLEAIASALEA
jgi:hypothetical protein